jgi:hypothetical protein
MSEQALGSTVLPTQWILGAPFLGDRAGWSWSWPTYWRVVQRLRLYGAVHLITTCTFLECRTMFSFHLSLFNLQVLYVQNVCLTSWVTISHGDRIQFQEWNCTITCTQQNSVSGVELYCRLYTTEFSFRSGTVLSLINNRIQFQEWNCTIIYAQQNSVSGVELYHHLYTTEFRFRSGTVQSLVHNRIQFQEWNCCCIPR